MNEPVEQGEKTVAADDIVVEVVEAVAEIGVVEAAVVAAVVTAVAVAVAAETVQASVYAAGLEPEVVEYVLGVGLVSGDVDAVDVDAVVVDAVKVVASASASASASVSALASVSASAANVEAVFAAGPEVWESGEGAESVVVEVEELSALGVKLAAAPPSGCRV